jgi:quercetin dioxygenase-like cupin family protein
MKEELRRLRAQPRVIKTAELPWKGGPAQYNRNIVTPASGITQSLYIHMKEFAPGGASQTHGHQNEALFYVLDGRGYDIHDGVKEEWEEGDVAIVPPGGIVHQHVNGDTRRPARVLIIKTKPLYMFLQTIFQKTTQEAPDQVPATDYTGPTDGPRGGARSAAEGGKRDRDSTAPRAEAAPAAAPLASPVRAALAAPRGETRRHPLGERRADFYARQLREAAAEQTRLKTAKSVVRADEMPWEIGPQGRLKHLVNGAMEAPIRTVDAYIQEVPAGSRSGKHRHMADELLYILEGRGYDLHWDVDAEISDRYHWVVSRDPQRLEWQAGDVVYIPVNTVHQHFNADAARPARFISATNRIFRYLGFDDLEQIEPAPEATP